MAASCASIAWPAWPAWLPGTLVNTPWITMAMLLVFTIFLPVQATVVDWLDWLDETLFTTHYMGMAYPSGPSVFAAHLSHPAGSLMWSLSLPGAPLGTAKLWCSLVFNASHYSICTSLRKIAAKQKNRWSTGLARTIVKLQVGRWHSIVTICTQIT